MENDNGTFDEHMGSAASHEEDHREKCNIRLKPSGLNIHRVVLTPLEVQRQCNSDVFFLSETRPYA
jgi:hypothetical protein